MKYSYQDKLHLSKINIYKLDLINSIIEDYRNQGYVLTLRQLYYQLVSKDLIPNNVKEYAKLSSLLVQGRMSGYVDWGAIEDRLRKPYIPYWVTGINDAINDVIAQYRLDRMQGQDCYIEVWTEKDALSGILKRITSYYHVNLLVNRGYSSCTAMYDASLRMQQAINDNKQCIVLYLGDHDPSGVDMVRDIQERFEAFEVEVLVKKIALTYKQIKVYEPPANPAKITDPRAKAYINRYGNVSWEVDALNPKVLHNLVKDAISKEIDETKFIKIIAQESNDIEIIKKSMKIK
jgi:hypothetical protein